MFDVTILRGALALQALLSFPVAMCILPIVPFYLSYLAGVGMNQISAEAEVSGTVRTRAVSGCSCFALGRDHCVCGAGGHGHGRLVRLVREYFDVLRWVAAAIIIAMGLHFLGVIRIGILYRQLRAETGNTSNVEPVGCLT